MEIKSYSPEDAKDIERIRNHARAARQLSAEDTIKLSADGSDWILPLPARVLRDMLQEYANAADAAVQKIMDRK